MRCLRAACVNRICTKTLLFNTIAILSNID